MHAQVGTVKVTVTGASGFIGRGLVEFLLNTGHDVQIITRNQNVLPASWSARVRVIQSDLHNLGGLSRIDGEIIFHLAGEIRDESKFWPTNVIGTENLLKVCAENGVKKFIHLSSVGVMGARKRGTVDENTICQPRNSYEQSKLAAEKTVLMYNRCYHLPVVVLRPSIVYGEGKKTTNDTFLSLLRSVQKGKFKFLGKAKSFYNIVYLGDVVNSLCALAFSNKQEGEIFIINDPVEWHDFIGLAQKAIGGNIKYGSIPKTIAALASGLGETLKLCGLPAPLTLSRYRTLTCQTIYSSEKIKKELNFCFKFGLATGLNRVVKYYKNNKSLEER